MSYIPPHKRKGATVALKPSDFPSLSTSDVPKAGAGGPSYISKASVEAEPAKTMPTFVNKQVRTIQREERIVEEKIVDKTPVDGEWITKESKSSKKTKPDSDWDGFEDY